jgi:hypothetical protein
MVTRRAVPPGSSWASHRGSLAGPCWYVPLSKGILSRPNPCCRTGSENGAPATHREPRSFFGKREGISQVRRFWPSMTWSRGQRSRPLHRKRVPPLDGLGFSRLARRNRERRRIQNAVATRSTRARRSWLGRQPRAHRAHQAAKIAKTLGEKRNSPGERSPRPGCKRP